MFPTHRALGPVPSSAVSPLPPSLLVQSVTDPLTAAGPSLSLPTHLSSMKTLTAPAQPMQLCLSRAKHQHPDPGLSLGGASLPQGAGGGSRPATQASCVVTSLMS